ncbi:MAG TPA: hypothetical protein PKC80_00895 [Burkholderiaceae bacterium]|nr:hypothetical protein [Burkholderiaceae bacterium]
MRAALFPYRLLAPLNLYIAALHQDNTVARAAFFKWLRQFSAEQIDFQQHKLISLLGLRFTNEIADSIHAGIIQNIGRQGRLRAHANLGELRQALTAPGLEQYDLIALGEIRECLLSDPAELGDCDSLELAIEQSDRDAAVECFQSVGWEIQNVPITSHGQQAIVVNLLKHGSKASLRIFGVSNLSQDKAQFKHYKALGVMTKTGHAAFMRSSAASLLSRRDQILFDIYRARLSRTAAHGVSGIEVNDLPLLFRWVGKKILG